MPPKNDRLYLTDPCLPCEARSPLDPEEGYSLAELQAMVGGYVEVVQLPNDDGLIMIVNEEGRLKGLPENWAASGIAGRRIVGPALVCRSEHVK